MTLPNLRRVPIAVHLVFLFLPVFILSTRSVSAAITQVGSITSMSISNDAISGNNIFLFNISSGGAAEVTPWASDVVRVRYHYAGLLPKEEPMIAKQLSNWVAVATSITDQGSTYLIQTPQLNVIVTKNPFKVDFRDPSGYYLLQDDHMEYDPSYTMPAGTGLPAGSSKLKCVKQMPANQAYFGFGEYAGPSNRRGLNIICWNNQSYHWGAGQNPMYMNMPFFYGVQPANGSIPAFAYGVFFDNPCRPTFRMGTQSSTNYSFEAGDGQMDYFFLGGNTNHSMKSVIDRYSELTGRPTMLPKWAMGYQLSRFSYWNEGWVEYIASTATASNIPLDAVYLDIDYMDANADQNISDGQLHQLTMNSGYPDPYGMVTNCASFGVKLIPLIEPWLEPADPIYTAFSTNQDFIKDNSSAQFTASIYVGNVSWFDYTSTPMRNRWKTKVMNWFNSVPLSGIWNDLSEPEDSQQIPINGLLWLDGRYGTSNTDTRRQWSNERNYFSLRQASSSYDILHSEYPNKRPFVLTRSGFPGVQQYAAGWSGDTTVDPFYLPACIRMGANTMISGQAYYGHDLGGFSGTVTGEWLTRWHEFGALLPLYRSHSQKGDNSWPDGNQGREPWRFSPGNGAGMDYCSLMRNNIQFRYRLMPYLYTLMRNGTVNGTPMNTPTAFNYYTDVNTYSLNEFDFLCGDYLLAAPIYTTGTTTRSVYLPWPSNWYYWPTNTKYGGGQTVTVNAPLGTLPLFVRGDAIIPMGPSMQYANQFQPTYLDINCWPETSSSFTLYEDAGEGWDFTNGVSALTTFSSSRSVSSWDFTIGARQGSYNPSARTYNIYVYNPDAVQGVKLNGLAIPQLANTNSPSPGWLITGDGRLDIRVTDTAALQTVHVDWNNTEPYSSMTVAGTFNGWDQTLNNMQYVGGRAWQYDVGFSALTNFQFKFAANGNWTTNWGENNGSQTQFTVPLSGTGKLSGSTNILANGTFNGLYRFTFNDQTLAYSVQSVLASLYGSMTLAGTFNGWNPALNNMLLISNGTWQCAVPFSSVTNIQFKFTANGNWISNWGENNGTQSQFGIPLTGTGKPTGSTNILINTALNGNYKFTFYEQSLQYNVQLIVDSVGEGVPDAWRAQYFGGNGVTNTTQSCALCDPDGDGMNNLAEYLTGTDPTNPASEFRITSIQPNGSDILINFTSVSNKQYLALSCSDPTTATWTNLPNGTITASGPVSQVADTGAATNGVQQFYKVKFLQ